MNAVDQALSELDGSRRRFLSELEGLADPVFGQRPPGGGWSVAQVVEHIARSEGAMATGFAAMLAGRAAPRFRPLDPLRRLAWTLGIYHVVTLRTTARLDPAEPLARETALAFLARSREQLLASLGPDPRLAATVRMRHPIFGPLRGDEMLQFASRHEERHRRQIVRIREALAAR